MRKPLILTLVIVTLGGAGLRAEETARTIRRDRVEAPTPKVDVRRRQEINRTYCHSFCNLRYETTRMYISAASLGIRADHRDRTRIQWCSKPLR